MTMPKPIEAGVLFDNDHTCCICNEKGKDVQIHHIDGDDKNNDPSNLAVLCLECHSRATGQRGFGRKYSPAEVRKYRRHWEFTVRKRRGIFETRDLFRRRDWVEFEISTLVFELAVTRHLGRAREILDLLDIHSVFGRGSTLILNELRNIVPFISSPKKSALVAEYVLHYFRHLPGPAYTKIDRADTRDLGNAINLLGWIGEFEAMARRERVPVVSSLVSLSELFEISGLYGQRKLQGEVLEAVRSIRKRASEKLGYRDVEMNLLVKKADTILRQLGRVYKAATKARDKA